MQAKILFVIDDLVIGGAERVLFELLENIDQSTYHCSIIALFTTETLGYKFEEIGISCHNLGLKKSNLFWSLRSLRSIIARNNYDIVQLIRPISRIIGTISTIGLPNVKLISRYDSMISCENFKYRFFEKIVIYRSVRIISPSKAVLQELTSSFGIPKIKNVVFYNGINGKVSARKIKFDDEKITIGTIGNYSWKKGYEFGLETIRCLADQNPNIKYQIIGRIDKNAPVHKVIRKYQLEENVEFLGEVNDISPFLNRWTIYFQPSRTEGFGFAILEAMSCGKPIVATNVGGIPELITNKINGLLVSPNDVEDAVTALKLLIADRVLCEQLGVNAKKTALNKFTLTQMVDNHEKLYHDVMSMNMK